MAGADVPFVFPWSTALARLGAATVIGAALGANRKLRGKPAGMRTHALVSLSASVVMLSVIQMATTHGAMDPNAASRAVQGLLVGVGFIGGGVIIKTGERGRVHNLTTAASVWLAACLGIACGAGQWTITAPALALTLVTLVFGGPIERSLRRFAGRGHAAADAMDDATDDVPE